jgi:hypothetical protein
MQKEKLIEIHHSLVELEQHLFRPTQGAPMVYNHPDAVLIRNCEELIERLVRTAK